MTIARQPSQRAIQAARQDPRLLRAYRAQQHQDPEWRLRAACRDRDPELFFPDAKDSPTVPLGICSGCPVQGWCLAFAMDNAVGNINGDSGVFGATTSRERRAMVPSWTRTKDSIL